MPTETNRTPVVSPAAPQKIRGHILVLIAGESTREVVRIGLERVGYTVTALSCPVKALCKFASDPFIKQIIVCEQIACDDGSDLMRRANKLGKQVVPFTYGNSVDPTDILSLTS
ncbi:MAG: hypothetical protein RLY66_386 [Candidatus Parcubacteria bacterium]